MIKRIKRYPEPENKEHLERLVLAIYVLHTIFLVLTVIILQWNIRALPLLCVGLALCIFISVKKYRTYTFRAFFTATMLWLNTAVYGFTTDDFIGMMPSAAAVLVVLGFYGLPYVIHVGNAFFTAMLIYHLAIARDIPFSVSQDGARILLRILSVYFISFTVYYMVKMQEESNLRLLENIKSLRIAEQSKDDFMANVSHEIRTPVNTVCGMSELVLQEKLSDEARAYLYGIQTAGRNLLSIVSDILDFSELQSGKISIVNDSYNITSVVNDVINMANAKNAEKSLELIVDCDPNIPCALIGDRQRIYRAVSNIVDNAIKFTQTGGVVIDFSTREESYGVNLCISVKDTGIGISPEMLEKIFTSFNQVDTHRNRATSGIGLGLAISRGMIDKMGGFLNVKSTYGEGTEVTMVIPQDVEDSTPCICVREPETVRILVYLQLANFKFPLIRSGYKRAIERMALGFGVSAYFCRNLAELKKRAESGEATHIFVGNQEYYEDPAYFENSAGRVHVTVIIERNYMKPPKNSRLLCIYAPFYALSIASVLNGEAVRDLSTNDRIGRFTAPNARALIVDDNIMNLKVAEGLLRPYKVKIATAGSGPEALEKLKSQEYDFVFMDHMMPGMDGVETFRRIKEKSGSYYKNLPVIALTANAVGNAREMFLEEGFADYISKPIEISALEHVLRRFIPREKMVYAGEEIPVPQIKRDESLGVHAASSGTAKEGFGLGQYGIDEKMGIAYCGGSTDDYIDIVRMYCSGGEENAHEIRRACAEKDWEQYVIKCHTLKSTSRSIGAIRLSELAMDLEASGKGKRLEGISEKTEEMLAEYERVLRILQENRILFPNGKASAQTQPFGEKIGENDAGELSKEEMQDVCSRLGALLTEFDDGAVTEYIDALGRKSYGGTMLSEMLSPVKELALDFDFIGAEDALLELLKKEQLI